MLKIFFEKMLQKNLTFSKSEFTIRYKLRKARICVIIKISMSGQSYSIFGKKTRTVTANIGG